MAYTLYRIVRSNPPSREDFLSNAARGRRLESPTTERLRLWAGLSSWATFAQAVRSARRHSGSGGYVATLIILDDAAIQVERTLGPGHHTIWGDPDELLGCIAAVEPVGR
jgi:hypothetical protein